jgi:hypothetical protein
VLGVDGKVAARCYGSEVGFAKTFLQGFRIGGCRGAGFVLAAACASASPGDFRARSAVDEDGNPVLGEDGPRSADVVEDVPASERFYAGGDTTVRGFALDRLGTDETLDPQGFPQGGNGLLLVNAEVRAPYWKSVGLVGFVDAGNVFKHAGDIELGDAGGAGFGARIVLPSARCAWTSGSRSTRACWPAAAGSAGSIVHISLGQAF